MDTTGDKHIKQINPVSERKILCAFSARYYTDSENYGTKIGVKLSWKTKDGKGKVTWENTHNI